MSAFVVSREHITRLVNIALVAAIDSGRTQPDPYDLGRMLWAENLKSVKARYPNDTDGNRPGPIDFHDCDVDAYTFGLMSDFCSTFDPVEMLKLINCYEYQTCEHKEWKESESFRWCQQMKHYLITQLPGYDEAKWAV